jgi:RNA polymerase sigma factor (sigma-70 family)
VSGGDWRDLLARVVQRDAAAQDELVARCHERVRDLVHRALAGDFRKNHRWILPLFSTRDVVQDVFVQVVRGLDGGDFPDEAAFVAYLGTVVRNRLLDAVRHHEAAKRDSRRRLDPGSIGVDALAPSRDPTPTLAASLAEQSGIVHEVFGSFPERQRLLLERRLIDGSTYPELARELGYASEDTARNAFLDAHAKLLVRLRAKGV